MNALLPHWTRNLRPMPNIPRPMSYPEQTILALRAALQRTPFWRFCLVGGLGFVADTAILLALVHGAGFGPVPAKILSFGVAIVLTFQLNRLWAFGATRHVSLGRAFATYLWVQGTGAACNLAVFGLLTARLPQTLGSLLFCAAIAAAAALLVNYLGASRFVFAAAGALRPGPLKP